MRLKFTEQSGAQGGMMLLVIENKLKHTLCLDADRQVPNRKGETERRYFACLAAEAVSGLGHSRLSFRCCAISDSRTSLAAVKFITGQPHKAVPCH